MVSFVYVASVADRNSADGWKQTGYKNLSAWISGAGAKKVPIPGLGPANAYCFALPDGRRVEAELLDEKTMRVRTGLSARVYALLLRE